MWYPAWVIYCNEAKTCKTALKNIVANLMSGPLRLYDWDITIRKVPFNLNLPPSIASLPPRLYEYVMPRSAPYADQCIYTAREVLIAPVDYWESSSPVLGFMGSFDILSHLVGMSILDVIHSPRLMIKYKDVKFSAEHLMYESATDRLYDPNCV